MEDEVVVVGIGEEAVFDNEDFIGGAAVGEEGVKFGAVEGLVGIGDGVVFYDGEGADGAPLVGTVLDFLDGICVYDSTFGIGVGVMPGDQG